MVSIANSNSSTQARPVARLPPWSLAVARSIGIVLGFIAIGYVGHETHWTFGKVNATPVDAPNRMISENESESRVLTNSGDWEIQFPSAKSLRRSGIKTTLLEQRPMHERIKTTGVIANDERLTATLSPRVPGTVWRVLKHAGDPVIRGETIIIIDAVEVGRAKAEFLSEMVAVESKSEILATRETIPDIISQRQIRDARVAVREARIRLQNAEQKLVNLGLQLQKEEYEKLSDLERAAKLQCLGLPETLVNDMNVERLSSNLLALVAPFDGVVIRNEAAIGEAVEAGKPVLQIADLRRMWLKLDVRKEEASKLALRQHVRFSPDGIDRQFDSTITWIGTELDEQTRTLQVRAEVDNPVVSTDPATGREVRLLRAHTFGTGTISIGGPTSVLAIPASAIVHADHQAAVFVQVGELSFKRCNVKLGLRDQQSVQIESDELKSGMNVVTTGSHALKSEWVLNHVASASN